MREVYRVPLGYKVAPMLANKARLVPQDLCLCFQPPDLASVAVHLSAWRHTVVDAFYLRHQTLKDSFRLHLGLRLGLRRSNICHSAFLIVRAK